MWGDDFGHDGLAGTEAEAGDIMRVGVFGNTIFHGVNALAALKNESVTEFDLRDDGFEIGGFLDSLDVGDALDSATMLNGVDADGDR